MDDRQLCMKNLKKSKKIKGRFKTCSFIWHINTLECVYLLDILQNTNTVHFCDTIFRHRTLLINRPSLLLSVSCLYIVHLGLGLFFQDAKKNCYNIGRGLEMKNLLSFIFMVTPV